MVHIYNAYLVTCISLIKMHYVVKKELWIAEWYPILMRNGESLNAPLWKATHKPSMQNINIWCKTTLHIEVISLVDPLSGLGDVDCRYHRQTDRRTDTMNTIYPHLGGGFNKNANSPNHTMWTVNCKHSWKQRWMTFVLFLTRIVTLFFIHAIMPSWSTSW